MRQAGVLAAAARVALAGWRRLEEDHELATRLASDLRDVVGEAVVERVDSNMVFLDQAHLPFPLDGLLADLRSNGVLVGKLSLEIARIVCHQDVDADDAERLLAVVRSHGDA